MEFKNKPKNKTPRFTPPPDPSRARHVPKSKPSFTERVDTSREFDAFRHTVPIQKNENKSEENKKKSEKVELNINLTMPKFDIKKINVNKAKESAASLWAWLKTLPRYLDKLSPRQRYIAAGSLCALLVFTALFQVISNHNKPEVQGVESRQAAQSSADIVPSQTPLFKTVTPSGKKIDESQIKFDSKRKFAKFDDNINGTAISVSQQPLPDTFKTDPEGSTQNAAKNFNATEKLTVGGQNMYFGVSAQGPQTVILTKKNLLIFINTVRPVDKEALKAYAASLD